MRNLEDDREMILDAICGVEPIFNMIPDLTTRGLGRLMSCGPFRWRWDRDALDRVGTKTALELYGQLKSGQAQYRCQRSA